MSSPCHIELTLSEKEVTVKKEVRFWQVFFILLEFTDCNEPEELNAFSARNNQARKCCRFIAGIDVHIQGTILCNWCCYCEITVHNFDRFVLTGWNTNSPTEAPQATGSAAKWCHIYCMIAAFSAVWLLSLSKSMISGPFQIEACFPWCVWSITWEWGPVPDLWWVAFCGHFFGSYYTLQQFYW